MQVKVKYFAALKQRFGRGEDILEVREGTDVLGLWRQLAGESALPTDVMTAINMEYVNKESVLHDGDEVAFFPPVTGG
ncbi:MAG: MoaD/ThiS family protein [Thiotrichales bacterium]|nr:MoaD/ThiS family protein [Thiotrichales bacterium]